MALAQGNIINQAIIHP